MFWSNKVILNINEILFKSNQLINFQAYIMNILNKKWIPYSVHGIRESIVWNFVWQKKRIKNKKKNRMPIHLSAFDEIL